MGDFKSLYPEFVPNQILTNTQLNQLREHLDLEQRRGLVRLSGAGIVCGLAWRGETASGKHSIRIDPGYGVSSDGYLVELCAERVCTHWRDYQDPDVDEEQDPRYGPWQKSGDRSGQKDIRELVEAERMAAEEPPEGARELRADTADGRVLVLYLEKEAVDLNSCLVTTCDNKGFNINLNVLQNIGPQLLLVSPSVPSMYKRHVNDFAEVTLTRWGNTHAASYTVSSSTYGGTAVLGTDFTAAAPVTFAPGDLSQTARLNPLNSNPGLYVGNKSIILGLAAGGGYSVGGGNVTLTLIDSANPPAALLYSNALVSASDATNWNVTGANVDLDSVAQDYEASFGYDLAADPAG